MNEPKKILLIHLFSNGDCLYATTIARQIKQDYPDCHLTWAIAAYCKSIIANNPFIDETIIIENINHANWKEHWKNFQKQVDELKKRNGFDKIFFTQLVGRNFANYDYCIRSAVFRSYGQPISVPVQPVLRLTTEEKNRVDDFAAQYQLSSYRHVVLLEFSPRSGQANFSKETALSIAEKITQDHNVAAILSSNSKIETGSPAIIDGSVLSIRETAYLSVYCTLLVGCSSGITWATTTDAGKHVPMLQILNPHAYWLNSVVNDHKRFGLSTNHIIEITDSSETLIRECVDTIFNKDFITAKKLYHTEIPVQFRITRGIICYLLGIGDVKGTIRHIHINLKLFGWKAGLLKSIFLGLATFPIVNLINWRKEQSLKRLNT